MAITNIGTSTSYIVTGAVDATPSSYSHTLVAGSNRVVRVQVHTDTFHVTDELPNVLGVTYGGVSMTRIAFDGINSASTGGDNWATDWYLLEASLPVDGSNTVEVTHQGISGSQSIIVLTSIWAGMSQTAPTGTAIGTDNATSGTTTVCAPTTDGANSLVLGGMVHNVGSLTFTPPSGYTELLDTNDGNISGCMWWKIETSASTLLSLTTTASGALSRAGATAVSWNEASAAAPTATGTLQAQSSTVSGTATAPSGRVQQTITAAVTTQGSVFENFAGTPPDGSIVIYPSEDNTAVSATGIYTTDSGSSITMWYQEVVDVSSFQTFTAISGAIGALQAQPSVISGAAVIEHTASGSLQSQVALVSGSAGNVMGELVAQSSVMNGSAVIDKASLGALQAQSASLSGTGIATSGFIAIGALAAQSSVLSGIAEREVKSSGSLQSQLSLMSGQGKGSASGVGSILSQASSMTGSGGKLWLPQITINTAWVDTTTAETVWVSNG